VNTLQEHSTGFPRLLESPGKWLWSWKVLAILVKGPGKFWIFFNQKSGNPVSNKGWTEAMRDHRMMAKMSHWQCTKT